MPQDYESGNFDLINVVEALPTYPLQEIDDSDHIVYKLRCRVRRAAYRRTVPQLDARFSPGECGIEPQHLPFNDSNAIFVGDVGHSRLPHDRIEFTRRFATFPKNQTGRFIGSRSWPFPAYRGYRVVIPKNTTDEDDSILAPYDIRSANSKAAPVYLDTKYFLISGEIPEIPQVFKPQFDGDDVDFLADSRSQILQNVQVEDPETGSKVSKSFNANVPATTPSLSAYRSLVSSREKIIIDVAFEQYLGNIYSLKIYKMIAQ
jgi:hypothetical protein